ncbi:MULTISPECIES: hypothetical protein [unclassified Achromobacter]|uniref:hypothetical protein n=1 Tax=unclassified Achromobacter TaxID=2626865 RepID=UPI001177AA44|nr:MULTISPECIES: hypothetical protein [unclassified Achromobacter]
MAASFCGLAGLVCWLAMLAVSKRCRAAMRAAPIKQGVGLLLVVLLSFPSASFLYAMWSIDQDNAREAAARRMTLAQAARIGPVDMPAGTRLTLSVAGKPETFTQAEFAYPVLIGGVLATRVKREITDEYDQESYDISVSYPTTMAVTGAGVQQVDGWRCDAARGVTFDTARDGTLVRMAHCVLAQGNTVAMPVRGGKDPAARGVGATDLALPPGHVAADIALPAGSDLRASSGNRYVDGFTDADRWEVEPPQGTVLRIAGLALLDPLIRLDGERRYFELPSGRLPCDLVLGEMHYTAGTRVRSAPRSWRDKHPDAWVFSPWSGTPARRDGHADIRFDQSVLQTPDAAVLAVVNSESIGVFRYPELIVEGEEAKPPAVQCPAPDGMR